MTHPRIIQGGMGIDISNWRLARAVSKMGHLGVVSGTALSVILLRRLQLGDLDGHMRRALAHFPVERITKRLLDTYYIPGGKPADQPFKLSQVLGVQLPKDLEELTVAANFVEVFLAKEGHSGLVGVNNLEKVQFPTLPSLYGAMLAGVDYVLMGAGVPRAIPGILDKLAGGEAVELKIDLVGAVEGEDAVSRFDPREYMGENPPALKRPLFLAIVSSATLATALARKSSGKVDGFVVELATAGGHNAPPRGAYEMNERGEPIYGPRDNPDLEKIKDLGLPFWMAGSFAEPEKLAEALQAGAVGIQVGTAFAFCDESGMDPELKRRAIDKACDSAVEVFTDPKASPTGFPFKVLQLEGTLSEASVYEARSRLCDLGGLRAAYRREDSSIGYRCPAEPEADYVRKGGNPADTADRKCLCNGLLATAGLGQTHANGDIEPPIMTAGDDVAHVARFLEPGKRSYSAADVLRYLLTPSAAPCSASGNPQSA